MQKEPDKEPFSVETIEPVDPWEDNNLVEEPCFTEEELASVLNSFDAEGETPDILKYPSGDILPELDVADLNEGQDSLLLPAEQLSSIFGPPRDNDGEDDESDSDKSRSAQSHLGPETDGVLQQPIQALDRGSHNNTEDLDLLDGLKNLNLEWQPEDDDIPFFMYCQSCTPTSVSSTAIEEHDTIVDPDSSANFRRYDKDRPKLPEKEFDTLLQLPIFGFEEEGQSYLTEKEMDDLFTTDGESHQSHTQQYEEPQMLRASDQERNDPSLEPFNVTRRPEAMSAANDILSSFVTNACGLKNERSCLGHKETIFGVSFSECGKYFATASQDSTVRIWNVATNASLATLEEHSKDYECLRVAW